MKKQCNLPSITQTLRDSFEVKLKVLHTISIASYVSYFLLLLLKKTNLSAKTMKWESSIPFDITSQLTNIH